MPLLNVDSLVFVVLVLRQILNIRGLLIKLENIQICFLVPQVAFILIEPSFCLEFGQDWVFHDHLPVELIVSEHVVCLAHSKDLSVLRGRFHLGSLALLFQFLSQNKIKSDVNLLTLS